MFVVEPGGIRKLALSDTDNRASNCLSPKVQHFINNEWKSFHDWKSVAQPVKETQSPKEIPLIRYVMSCTLCKVISWASSENIKEDFERRKRGQSEEEEPEE